MTTKPQTNNESQITNNFQLFGDGVVFLRYWVVKELEIRGAELVKKIMKINKMIYLHYVID